MQNDPADGNEQPEFSAATPGARLRQELADLKNDLDALMLHQATLSDDELSEAYARIMARLGSGSTAAKNIVLAAEPPQYAGFDAICAQVQRRPVQSVLTASLIGMLLARLTRRDCR